MRPAFGFSGKTVRRLPAALALAVALAVVPGGAAGQEAPAADLTGSWIFTVDSPNGSGTRDVVFEQDGNELTGTISSTMATGELEGTVEGDRVSFVVFLVMDSGVFEVSYRASLEDGELVDGEVDFGSYGSGTFVGRRTDGDA